MGRVEALLGLLLQAVRDDVLQIRRNLRTTPCQLGRLSFQNRRHGLCRRRSQEVAPISYSTQPREKISLRASAGGAPRTRPKSRMFTQPSEVRKRFSGFRSRWMTPFECAVARPSAMAIPISTALRQDSAACPRWERKVSPSSSYDTGSATNDRGYAGITILDAPLDGLAFFQFHGYGLPLQNPSHRALQSHPPKAVITLAISLVNKGNRFFLTSAEIAREAETAELRTYG